MFVIVGVMGQEDSADSGKHGAKQLSTGSDTQLSWLSQGQSKEERVGNGVGGEELGLVFAMAVAQSNSQDMAGIWGAPRAVEN